MKYYTFSQPTPRRSWFRMRGQTRDIIEEQEWGRRLRDRPESFDVRIIYRTETRAPLGDFPDIEEGGLIASKRALDVFWNEIEVFFEKLPVTVTGGGVEKKSGIWYAQDLEELPEIADMSCDYYYLHPSRSLQREHPNPSECPEFKLGGPQEFQIGEAELDRKTKQAKEEYLGWLGELKADIGSNEVPPIFVAGTTLGFMKNPASIYFTDEFKQRCKKNKLRIMRLREVIDGINPWTGLPLER